MYKSNNWEGFTLSFLIILLGLFQNCGDSDKAYMHFSGERSLLRTLEAGEVMFFYPDGLYQKDSMSQLLETYDRAYLLALELSGRKPAPADLYTDKLPVAIVPTTCGPGCGRLGAKGIEITEAKFDRIYREFVGSGRHDHLFFYELGRNFWFYGEGDGEWGEIHTGFAVFFRDLLIRELGLIAAPINGEPYERYMERKRNSWEAFCKETAGLSWGEMQFHINRHFPHAPLFWSSLWWELYLDSGTAGVSSALKALEKRQLPGKAEAWYGLLDVRGSD